MVQHSRYGDIILTGFGCKTFLDISVRIDNETGGEAAASVCAVCASGGGAAGGGGGVVQPERASAA
jgi:hypothetical protein